MTLPRTLAADVGNADTVHLTVTSQRNTVVASVSAVAGRGTWKLTAWMSPTAAHGRRRRLLIMTVLTGAAASGVALAVSAATHDQPSTMRAAAATAPPSREITRLSAALAGIGTRCRDHRSRRDRRLAADAAAIVAFTRRYPHASFVLDDEHATPLAVLLVARQALRGCDPPVAATIDAALPAGYRGRTG